MRIYEKKEQTEIIKYQTELNNNFERRELTAKRELRRIEDIIHIKHIMPNAKNVLCIGARDDSEVMSFIKAGYDATGIDICTQTPLIRRMGVEKLHEEEQEFDIIYCSHVLEHISFPVGALKAIRSIARGIIFVILPIVDREPDIEHPTIYDVMRYNPETNFKDFPRAWNDFRLFKPYEIKYCCYRNALTEDYEIAIIFEVN